MGIEHFLARRFLDQPPSRLEGAQVAACAALQSISKLGRGGHTAGSPLRLIYWSRCVIDVVIHEYLGAFWYPAA